MKRLLAVALLCAIALTFASTASAQFATTHWVEKPMVFSTHAGAYAAPGNRDSLSFSSAYLNADTTAWFSTLDAHPNFGWGDDAATDTLTWIALQVYGTASSTTLDSLTVTIQGSVDGQHAYSIRAAAVAIATGNMVNFNFAPLQAVRSWPNIRAIFTAVGGDKQTLYGKWVYLSTRVGS